MKKIILIFTIFLCSKIYSREVITCTNDSIKLKATNYKFGIIEWEKSNDGENWEKIANELDTTYVFKTNTTSYYRAVNKLPNCEWFYIVRNKTDCDELYYLF